MCVPLYFEGTSRRKVKRREKAGVLREIVYGEADNA
jgi:hypothetical protein